MSDTESFESVINKSFEIAKAKLQIAFEGKLFERLLSDLQAAHDREIRDVGQHEYHRGYVDAMHARATETWQLDRERMEIVRGLREFRCADIEPWFEMQFWTLLRLLGVESDASTPADCDDVAHLRDRLIHLLGGDSNSANTVSEDAEFAEHSDDREKVVRKLQALRFDGGSHENLSKIAYAIYPCATGWTCESAKGLRDSLVRLIGGDDGGHCLQSDVCCGSCADGGAGDSRELAEVVTFANIRKKRDELAATMEQLKDELDRIKGLLQ